MRSIVVWLIGILLLPGWMGHLYAQMPEPTPTVTLDMRQVPLLDILMELEKQTGLFFSYESSLLKELPEVSLSVRDESLSYCLKRLFSPLPIIYGAIYHLKAKAPSIYDQRIRQGFSLV